MTIVTNNVMFFDTIKDSYRALSVCNLTWCKQTVCFSACLCLEIVKCVTYSVWVHVLLSLPLPVDRLGQLAQAGYVLEGPTQQQQLADLVGVCRSRISSMGPKQLAEVVWALAQVRRGGAGGPYARVRL